MNRPRQSQLCERACITSSAQERVDVSSGRIRVLSCFTALLGAFTRAGASGLITDGISSVLNMTSRGGPLINRGCKALGKPAKVSMTVRIIIRRNMDALLESFPGIHKQNSRHVPITH